MSRKEFFTYANILTLIRLIISPLTLPFLLYFLLPYNIFVLNIILAIVFVLFALTDFFDGYCARKFDQVSQFGALLDPIADKFLLNAALICLVAVHKLFFFWAIVLIGREFFVTGLRLIALEGRIYLPVSSLAKVKTVVQMMYIAVIIANPMQDSESLFSGWNLYENILLILALALSLLTAYWYFETWQKTIKIQNDSSTGTSCPL